MSELLPTGTVTLLLADVEGSTRLWETQPEEMTAAFALLDRTLAKTVAAHNGVRPVEQGEGDSFVLAFTRASDAVACALDLQKAPHRTHAEMQQLLEHGTAEMDNLRAAFSWSADLEPDPDVLTKAAYSAAWLVDLALADRLADAAVRGGGGADASLIRAFTLSFLGHGAEADAVLVEACAREPTEAEHAELAFLQATNRLFVLADPDRAKRVVDRVAQMTARENRSCIDAFLTVYWAAMGKPRAAKQSSQSIAWDRLPDVVARATSWAMTVAAGDAGSPTVAVSAAETGYGVPIRGYFVISDAHVGALLMAGRIQDAHDVAEMFGRRASAEFLRQFEPITNTVAGRVAVGAGSLETACSLLDSAAMTFAALGENHGWWYRTQLPRTTALAMSGLADEAAAALLGLEEKRHPAWRYLDYEYAIAQAWVFACHDAVGEAIKTLLSAAETARANGQFAAEVICLQTAAQFGDGSSAERLRELAAIVEGMRAGLAARFAAALNASDAAEMAAVSEDFEQIGDLIAAIDSAAHAAIAYDRDGMRALATGCATRAETLAERCGAHTPALRRVSSIGR